MKRLLQLVVFCLALCRFASGQSATVVYQKTIQISVPGATAAYSLDPLNADASAANGIIVITGKGPGSATVMVVTPDGVRRVAVTVLQPPPSYPAGFVAPTLLSNYGENGEYEFRYSSDPSQWQNNLDMIWHNGSRRTQLRIDNANLFSPAGSELTFPNVSYAYSSPNREFVLLDDEVNNSPLTVNDTLIRGFHYKQGPWEFHSGVTSQTSFREFLLSTGTEAVAGVSRSFRLTKHSEIIPNLYYFGRVSDNSPGQGGAVGSVVYRFKASDEFQYSLEMGISRGIGGAGEIRYSNDASQLHAQFRYTPVHFAGLGINQMPGQSAQADYTRSLTSRLATNVIFSHWTYDLAGGSNGSTTLSGLLRYALARHWNVNGGVSASRFSVGSGTAGAISSLALPIGIDFATARFGAGASYQRQIGGSPLASGETQVRGNARVNIGPVQVSGFASQQTNTPTLQTLVPKNSPLAEAVGTESVLSNSPDSVASGLHDNLILAGLGYVKAVGLAVASTRMQYGASVNWIGHGSGHDQLSYNFLASDDTLPTGNMAYMSHSFAYTRRITATNDVSVALSLVSLTSMGRTGLHPRFQVDARHRFTSVPAFFAPGGHGLISGRVFQDDAGTGNYTDDAHGLTDIEIVLDGQRRTRTDARGVYAFDHVPAGPHEIEAIPHLNSPYYFTTSSTQPAEINARINFGIAFSAGQVFGYVRNDASHPVDSVTVHIRGPAQEFTANSDDNGRFERRSLPRGEYEVWIDPMSIPAGYALVGLKHGTVEVNEGASAEWDASLKAIRSIAGRIVAYDPTKGREVGVSSAVVLLRELPCAVVTDKNGNYRFKELPPGTYTVAVVYHGKEHTSTVSLREDPDQIRDANINVGAR